MKAFHIFYCHCVDPFGVVFAANQSQARGRAARSAMGADYTFREYMQMFRVRRAPALDSIAEGFLKGKTTWVYSPEAVQEFIKEQGGQS